MRGSMRGFIHPVDDLRESFDDVRPRRRIGFTPPGDEPAPFVPEVFYRTPWGWYERNELRPRGPLGFAPAAIAA